MVIEPNGQFGEVVACPATNLSPAALIYGRGGGLGRRPHGAEVSKAGLRNGQQALIWITSFPRT